MSIQSLTRDELLAVLGHAKAKRKRDWLLILLAFNHGLRASEAVGLTTDNFSSTHITVQRLKGSKRTVQPLHEDENDLLDEAKMIRLIVGARRPNQKLFNISRVRFFQIFREHAVAAGIPESKCHPHVLKHSIAMQVIKTAGIENVKQFLGHKSGSSTLEYLKVTDDDAAAAVKKARTV